MIHLRRGNFNEVQERRHEENKSTGQNEGDCETHTQANSPGLASNTTTAPTVRNASRPLSCSLCSLATTWTRRKPSNDEHMKVENAMANSIIQRRPKQARLRMEEKGEGDKSRKRAERMTMGVSRRPLHTHIHTRARTHTRTHVVHACGVAFFPSRDVVYMARMIENLQKDVEKKRRKRPRTETTPRD